MQNSLLFFFATLGVFNGLLVSAYFLLFSKPKTLAKVFFGLLILMLSLRIGKSVVLNFDRSLPKIYLQIGLTACFFIGPMLYFYLRSAIKKINTIPKNWKLHLTVLSIIILSFGVIYPYPTRPEIWNNYGVPGIYTVWFIYMIMSGLQIITLLKITRKNKQHYWWIAVYMANILVFFGFIFGYYALYITGSIVFTTMFYALAIFLLSQKGKQSVFEEWKEKYGDKRMPESETAALIAQLKNEIEQQQLFKNPNLKIKDVAREMHISVQQLSLLINDNFNQTFNTFINTYRVEDAKRLLIEKEHFTLEAIGYEAGFSSKSTFYATFKKFTNTTPSEYQQSVQI